MSSRRGRAGSAWARHERPLLLRGLLLPVLVLLSLLACGRAPGQARSAASESADGDYGYEYANDPSNAPGAAPAEPAPAMPAPAPLPAPPSVAGPELPALTSTSEPAAASAPGTAAVGAEGQNAPRAPLLIYTATLTLAVFGTDAALDAVERLAQERRGYLVRRTDRSITIRVPAESFKAALDGVGKLGDELHRDVNAQDVSDEYADLKLRLRNSEIVRQRLEVLLERASKVEDALAVQRELERVTRDIEQLKGRLALLGELLRFSTITVHFEPVQVESVTRDRPLPFDWLQRLGLPHLLSL